MIAVTPNTHPVKSNRSDRLIRWRLSPLFLLAALITSLALAPGHTCMAQTQMGVGFNGPTGLDTFWWPNDPNAAVGPNHVMLIINGIYRIYTKSGTLVGSGNIDSLFTSLNASVSTLDPNITYDDISGRFILEANGSGSDIVTAYLAVSDTSDPTQGFTEVHSFNFPGASDGSKAGFNADVVVICATSGTKVIQKSTLLDKNNSTLTVTYSTTSTYGRAARMHGATTGLPMYFTSANSGFIHVTRMDNVLNASPTFTQFNVSGSSGCTDPATPAWRNNSLVTANTGAMYWWQVNVSGATPTLTQQGLINPPSGYVTGYGSANIAPNGDMGLSYLQQSSDTNARPVSMWVAWRAAADTAGTMRTPIQAVTSGSLTSANARHGDFSSTVSDIDTNGVTLNTFWSCNGYILPNGGGSTEATWMQNFGGTLTAPVITTQPQSATVFTGSSVTFSLQASGQYPLSYQWQKNGVNISGATSSSYTISSTTVSDAGSYAVVVANAQGNTTSAAATLTVIQPPTAVSINFQGGSGTTPMASGESAGAVSVPQWNNATGVSGSLSSLTGSDGLATGASTTWSCNNTWSTPIVDAAGNSRMMKGYLDTSATSTSTVTVSGLSSSYTANGYDIYVYCDGDNGGTVKTGRYTIGTTTITATDNGGANFSGTFTQANNSAGNYVVFTNQTASSFTLSAVGTSTDSGPRAPVNGIQIVARAAVGPPPAPTGLAAVGGNVVVNLTWTQSTGTGITSNRVYRSTTGSGGTYNLLATLAATTSYSDTAVVNGNTYYYEVSAVNANGESALSAFSSATPSCTIPATPTGLSATPGNNQVALSWSASSGATSYNVKRATVSGGPYTTISSPSGASFTDTTAVNGTTYYYVVSAVSSCGESANSAQVSATPSCIIPATPTGLTATPGDSQVSLSWTAASGATSYNVKRSTTSGGPYTLIASLVSTSFTDTALVNGTTYYYVVSAVNCGESANSVQVSATPVAGAVLLSQGRPATASSSQGANTPADGDDGSLSTRWNAGSTSFPQWWRVDLGASHNLSQVAVNWYNTSSRNYQYKIEVSTNDVNYTMVVNQTGRTGFGDTADNISASGRYVRVTVTGSTTGSRAAFNECKVYGSTTTNMTPTLILPPTDLTAQGVGRAVKLAWTPPTEPNITAINIYRAFGDDEPRRRIASIPPGTDYTDQDPILESKTDYFYWVTAVYGDAGESQFSDMATVTTK